MNIPSLIKSIIFMIQKSLSVKLPYDNIIQRSPGNDVAVAWPKVLIQVRTGVKCLK